jgi:hypothetical protein
VSDERTITLVGGPFDGQTVPEHMCPADVLLTEGTDVPQGMVARYRRDRKERDTFRFSEYDRVVARLPEPGASA